MTTKTHRIPLMSNSKNNQLAYLIAFIINYFKRNEIIDLRDFFDIYIDNGFKLSGDSYERH